MNKIKIKTIPRVSVVVPVYNGIFFIEKFLKSILDTRYQNFEVILIDDDSTDGTTQYIVKASQKDPRIKLIQTLYRKGLTRSRNMGIESASGEYIAFAEVDMEFEHNWLSEAVKELEEDKTLGAVTGKVLDIKNKNLIQTIGLKIMPQTSWVICLGFGMRNDKFFPESGEVSMGAVGSVARKSVLRRIRGYDEGLIRNVEDIDLGWRIWISGYRIISVPTSITYHVTKKDWRVRLSSVSRFKQDVALSQITRLLIKNYELRNVLLYLPQAIVILFFRALINLVKGNPYSLISFIYVIFWTIYTLPSTLRERKYIATIRKAEDKKIFKSIMVKDNLFSLYFNQLRDVNKRMARFPLIK